MARSEDLYIEEQQSVCVLAVEQSGRICYERELAKMSVWSKNEVDLAVSNDSQAGSNCKWSCEAAQAECRNKRPG